MGPELSGPLLPWWFGSVIPARAGAPWGIRPRGGQTVPLPSPPLGLTSPSPRPLLDSEWNVQPVEQDGVGTSSQRALVPAPSPSPTEGVGASGLGPAPGPGWRCPAANPKAEVGAVGGPGPAI